MFIVMKTNCLFAHHNPCGPGDVYTESGKLSLANAHRSLPHLSIAPQMNPKEPRVYNLKLIGPTRTDFEQSLQNETIKETPDRHMLAHPIRLTCLLVHRVSDKIRKNCNDIKIKQSRER